MARRQGFVFSLDAFVAFSLILIAIQTLVLVSASPSGYYTSLLQAQFLAKDTLHAISTTALEGRGVSALGAASADIASGRGLTRDMPIIKISDQIIQKPYSYAYSYYDMASQKWMLAYNASDNAYDPDGPHANVSFSRVQASAQKLMLEYSSPPVRPESPYCNVYCRGWRATTQEDTPAEQCLQSPCDAQGRSAYQVGNMTFGLLRLTVWG